MEKNNLKEIVISKFTDFTLPPSKISVFEELLCIKNGTYSEKITVARFYYQKDNHKYQILKRQLPSVTFSGLFNRKRTLDDLERYSGFLILDIDKISKKEALNNLKNNIFLEDFVIGIWISPSGIGLKVLIKLDTLPEYHALAFHALVLLFKRKFEIDVDISGSDITRLCFSSFDPDLLLKDSCIGFSETQIVADNKEIPIFLSSNSLQSKIDLTQLNKSNKVLLFSPEGRNQHDNRHTIQSIIKYLKYRKISITSTYEQWYKIALAIANTFTFELGSKYYLELCRLDLDNHNEEASINMLRYCYLHRRINAITFATIVHFAQEKGYQVNYLTSIKKE